jgi:galactitol-specific phosphotransferase system IIB component
MTFDYVEPTNYHFRVQTNIDLNCPINEIINKLKNILIEEFDKPDKYVKIKEINYSEWNSNYIEFYIVISSVQVKQSFEELENRVTESINNGLDNTNTSSNCVKTQP